MDNIYKELAGAVVAMDENKVISLAKKVLEGSSDIDRAITEGLEKGMETVGVKYEQGDYFVPELLIAFDVMNVGLNILQPRIKTPGNTSVFTNPRVIIGVMEGDFHEIGKDLVKIMLETAGFHVTDLGRDVSIKKFLDAAVKEDAGLICLSSLMSTSMLGMNEVISLLVKKGLRKRFKIMVGGACVTADYARKIGADGYAANAAAAMREAKKLMKITGATP